MSNSNIKMNIWLPGNEYYNEFREAGQPKKAGFLPGVRQITHDVQVMPSHMEVPHINLDVHDVREEILERFPFRSNHFGNFRTKYWEPDNAEVKVTFYT